MRDQPCEPLGAEAGRRADGGVAVDQRGPDLLQGSLEGAQGLVERAALPARQDPEDHPPDLGLGLVAFAPLAGLGHVAHRAPGPELGEGHGEQSGGDGETLAGLRRRERALGEEEDGPDPSHLPLEAPQLDEGAHRVGGAQLGPPQPRRRGRERGRRASRGAHPCPRSTRPAMAHSANATEAKALKSKKALPIRSGRQRTLRSHVEVLGEQDRGQEPGAEEPGRPLPPRRAGGQDERHRHHVEPARPGERAVDPEAGRDRRKSPGPIELHVLHRVEDVEAGDPGAHAQAEQDRRGRRLSGQGDGHADGTERLGHAQPEVAAPGEALRVGVAEQDGQHREREPAGERGEQRRHGHEGDARADEQRPGRRRGDRSGDQLPGGRARVLGVEGAVGDAVHGHGGGARRHHGHRHQQQADRLEPGLPRHQHHRGDRERQGEEGMGELHHSCNGADGHASISGR